MILLFFLLLLGIAVAVIFYHLPRRIARRVLLVAGLMLLGCLLAALVRVLLHERGLSGPAWAFHFFLFCALGYLFFRGVKRLLQPLPADDAKASWPVLGAVRRFLATRLLPWIDVRQVLLVIALFVVSVVFLWLAGALLFEHRLKSGEFIFLFLMLWVLGFLFVHLLKRLLQPRPPADRAIFCPPVGRLKELLADRLPAGESARLTEHLEECPACQRRVEGLAASRKSWPELARKLSDRPPEPAPALREVMDKLKDSQEEQTSDEVISCGELPLGFLRPSDKPGQLGRLERYEVLEEIGRGGMGVVLKAFDPSLHRMVAIKVLAPQLASSGVARKRFLREAKAAAAVTHDHIVTIHSVEESNGLPFLVMQLVAGQSLQERLDKEGPLEVAEVLRIGMQTASALAAAHGQGIVHRDVKPANILLEGGQRVKITDFGLARAMDDASMTQSGFVAGSPLYMAPEQARGESLDHRADLFSLGSVLYTLCTGRPPFRAANTLAVLRRVSEDSPRAIRESNPEIPDALAAVIEKLMAKNPADRFASAAEVVEVLGHLLAPLQAAWPPPAPAVKVEPAGLPTSVTICPSCGASLHVPDAMLGRTVHCAECRKPFHAEGGSEEILIARAMPWPFGNAARAKWKFPFWVWLLSAILGMAGSLLLA
jgi:hypothetical protein